MGKNIKKRYPKYLKEFKCIGVKIAVALDGI